MWPIKFFENPIVSVALGLGIYAVLTEMSARSRRKMFVVDQSAAGE
jgi:hypothetical protein